MDTHALCSRIRATARRITPAAVRTELWCWIVIEAGFFLWALAIVLRVQANLGLGPWDVFHVGLARIVGVSLGRIIQIVGLAVIVASYLFARIKPGWGTLGNMVFIGIFIDWIMPHVPKMHSLPAELAMLIGGIVLTGPATAIYFSAGLGAGPRDSLMLALARTSGWSIRSIRVAIELTVLAAGALMGGKVGFGTVLAALGSGPAIQVFLRLMRVEGASRKPAFPWPCREPAHAPARARGGH